MAEPDTLFVEEEPGVVVPTELSRGPWDPNALHGGPVSALLARAIEQVETPGPMHVARLTVELERPVTLQPLHVRASVTRPGRRVQLVDADLFAGESRVARGRALRIRTTDLDYAAEAPDPAPPAGPDSVETQPWKDDWGYVAYHSHGVEMRFVKGGDPETTGPVIVWMRLRVPVLAGEEPSPVQRAAAVADFGNGVSAVLSFDQWSFINPDLTVSMYRPPVGEWICLDAATALDPSGIGMAQSVLSDTSGPFGRAVQLLYVDRR
jgi:hypothetical protein